MLQRKEGFDTKESRQFVKSFILIVADFLIG